MIIPEFNDLGRLPEGVHWANWTQFKARFDFSLRRKRLLRGLFKAISDLSSFGCKAVYVNGSFVTFKKNPNDYDACWDSTNMDLAGLLQHHPVFWNFDNGRIEQKKLYYGEFFPANEVEVGSGELFLDFFQNDKEHSGRKGIIGLKIQ